MDAVIIEILCNKLSSKFRCDLCKVSCDCNRIASHVSGKHNPMFKRMFLDPIECGLCAWMWNSRKWRKDNLWRRDYPTNITKHVRGVCRRSDAISRDDPICYHTMMRLNRYKLATLRFTAHSADPDIREFGHRYAALYQWSPNCRAVARGERASTWVCQQRVTEDEYERVIRITIMCHNIDAFDQMMSYRDAYIPACIDIPPILQKHIATYYISSNSTWRIRLHKKDPRANLFVLFDTVDIRNTILGLVGARGRANAVSVCSTMATECLWYSMNINPNVTTLYMQMKSHYTHVDIAMIFQDYHLFVRIKQTFEYSIPAIIALACPEVALHVFARRKRSDNLADYQTLMTNSFAAAFRQAHLNVITHIAARVGEHICFMLTNTVQSIAAAYNEFAGTPRNTDVIAVINYYADISGWQWMLNISCDYGSIDMIKYIHARMDATIPNVPHHATALTGMYTDCIRAASRRKIKTELIEFLLQCMVLHNLPLQFDPRLLRSVMPARNPTEYIIMYTVLQRYRIAVDITSDVIKFDIITMVDHIDVNIRMITKAIKHGAVNILNELLTRAKLSVHQLNKLTRVACISYGNMHALQLLLKHGANYCKCDKPLKDHAVARH